MLRGFVPVMVTAFSPDGSIDYEGMDALVEFYIKNGATGLFTVCLTSEMYLLSPEERLQLTEHVSKKAESLGFEGPVLATGTFGGPVNEQADFIRRVSDAGADIVVMIPNQLASQTEDDACLSDRVDALVSMTNSIPLGFYECPSPYHRLTSPELLSACAGSGRFGYIKETSADMDKLKSKIQAAGSSSMAIFSAHQQSILPFLKAGGHGVSPIGANATPKLVSTLYKCFDEASERPAALQAAYTDVAESIAHRYPLNIKWYLNRKGIPIEPICRTDGAPITAEDTRIFGAMSDAIDGLLESLDVQNTY